MTRGESNAAWIEKHCRVPQDKLIAQPVRLTMQHKALARVSPEIRRELGTAD